MLSDTGHNKSIEDLFRVSEMNDSWREDRSSVSSWSAGASGAGTFTSFNTSLSAMSSSPSPQSPVVDLPGTHGDDTIESENSQLLSRLAEIQQEKWNLEEKVRHLETSTAAMADDLLEKSRIIEHYVMESRTETKQHTPVHEDKISLKKVLDLVNKNDDQGLRDMNKKLQHMLEETLTKNMHLQQDLETLSKELVRLSKLDSAVEMVNKNSSDASLCSAKPSPATPSS